MDGLSKCHKFALKEVLGAVGLLQSRRGSSAQDIYFVLDNLHGKVQRPVINYALKAAVKKGLLNCVNNQYKLRRRRGVRVQRSRVRTAHKAISRTSRKSVKSKARSSRRNSLSEVDYSGSDYDVPVRNYECNPTRKPKTRRSSRRRTYRFQEVSSVESCNRCADCVDYSDTDLSSVYSDYSQYSSDYEPRKKAKKPKRKYPMPKKIKVEKKSSNESEVDVVRPTKKSKTTSTIGKKRKANGNKRSSSAKGPTANTTQAATASPTLQEPQAGPSRMKETQYNLRPRGNKRVHGKKRDRKAQTEESPGQPAENSVKPSNAGSK